MRQDLLAEMREGRTLTAQQQLILILRLSFPAILAQLSSIVMQYIDASMVGRLGASDSASIGLMSSSTWLMGGLCSALSTGFTVQVAHRVGAGDEAGARAVVRQGLAVALAFGCLLLGVGVSLHRALPRFLGGGADIVDHAGDYFLIYALSLPLLQLNGIAGGFLQCSGNMRVPSVLHVCMCGLDVVFNSLLIFPTRTLGRLTIPGAGLGVTGAALGTALAELVVVCAMLAFLLLRSPALRLRRGERLRFSRATLTTAWRIGAPVGLEQMVICTAYVAATKIVAPLGTVAIAANSFSVTAESLCYMPGFGIGTAATTLIGQSIGAGRHDLTRRLGWRCTLLGIAVMAGMGALLYLCAPWMIGLLSPDAEIRALGAQVLRIEAFAEPMYAASIVASGVFRGAGDTLVPSCLNFCSMWLVRLPLSALLAPRLGLRGVWIAMTIELCVRGALFLIRLCGRRWMKKAVQA